MARASLCVSESQPESTTLLHLAEQLLSRAATTLRGVEPLTTEHLAAMQHVLGPTFIGTLLPWMADSLTLYSAHPFEQAWRLLPALLPLLQTLRHVLATDGGLDQSEFASGIQNARAVRVETPHPYKPAMATTAKKLAKDKRGGQPVTSQVKHSK